MQPFLRLRTVTASPTCYILSYNHENATHRKCVSLSPTPCSSPIAVPTQPHADALQGAVWDGTVAHRPIILRCGHGLSRYVPRPRRTEVCRATLQANWNSVPNKT